MEPLSLIFSVYPIVIYPTKGASASQGNPIREKALLCWRSLYFAVDEG
jgi:hypothetical protein